MTKSSKQLKCDINLITGWYRFHGQAGQQMPTSCVQINHCGANAPGWINGTHPSVADGASAVQVCFNWGHNCCRWSTYIRVRNCSGFYVYELKKTPGCRLRYCGNGTQGTVETHIIRLSIVHLINIAKKSNCLNRDVIMLALRRRRI